MRLQDSTLEDLRNRAQVIQGERESWEARIRGLSSEETAIAVLLREYSNPGAEGCDLKKRTRSDHIKGALKSIKEGSPTGVAEEMLKLGWKWNGDVKPGSIVAVELNRLSSINGSGVEWVERGLYRFVGET